MDRFRLVAGAALLAATFAAFAQYRPLGDNFVIASPGPDAIGGRPGVASNGTDFLVGWRPPGGTTVDYARVSSTGAVLSKVAIATGAGAHVPSIAFGGTQYLVVWAQGSEVRGARVSTSGTLLDATPLALTSGGDVKDRPVTVAFDGTRYLVAWRTNGDVIRGKRFDANVAALDGPSGFVIGTGFYPWAAAGGGTFAVSWHKNGTSGLDVAVARVAPDGTVTEPGGVVIDLPGDQDHSSIAFGEGTFLVAWHDWRNMDAHNNGEAHALLLSPSGTRGAPFRVSDMVLWQVPVQVAYDGRVFLVAWHAENPSAHRMADSYVQQVSTSGQLINGNPRPLGTGYWHQWGPVIGANSLALLAAWSDRRDGSSCAAGCVQAQLYEFLPPVPAGEELPATGLKAGGAPWIAETGPLLGRLNSVATAPGDVVYVAGEGPIWRRQAGNWQAVHDPNQRMFGLWADPQTGHARAVGFCWSAPYFDGQSWDAPQCRGGLGTPDPAQIGFAVWGSGADFAMTVGTEGVWQRFGAGSSNGRFPTNATMRGVWGASPNLVYAVGEFGKVFRWDGAAWTQVSTPTAQSFNAVWGSGPNDVFAVGDFGTVYRFNGTAFEYQPTPTTAHLLAVSGSGPNDVYAVGSRGTILHYDGVQWRQLRSGPEWLFGVATRDWKAWAVGENGTVLRREIAGGATGDEDADGVPNGVEVAEGLKPFVKDNDIFANARLFAMQQYRDFLGREGDAGGVTYWANQLASGAQTRAQMAETYFNSPEFQGTGAPMVRLYFAYFLRIPDYGGLNYWMGRFRSGESLQSISNLFATSPEFVATYGALDNAGFVDRVYRNVLGRAPDAAGLAYWKAQIDGGMSRGAMMAQFSESPEYRALIGNEVYVTMMYVAMLRRAPDAGGFSYWVGYMDAGNSGLALTGAFVGAAEYRGRFLP